MTQEERWQAQYDQMMAFMEENHRRPSKYKLEEHDMLNWFKSNKKMMNKGTFPDREFGELVDDWYAHNNLNRASRSWGERPQLVQALSLLNSTNELYKTTGQFIGGCQWHPFDHQRGYHPDPYWGGIYDAFRQPKTALNMFKARLTSVLSDAEKAKMLQEVEAQQADFGLQK